VQLNVPLVPGILVCSAFFCFILANITFYTVLGEVNGRRDPQEQISMFLVDIRVPEVMRLHKQLFPDSKKRTATYVFFIFGFVQLFSVFLFHT
jgi:hypothetical protein